MTNTRNHQPPIREGANILIFGGTVEGRELARALAEYEHRVTLSVTTDYGRKIAAADRFATVVQSLDAEAMTRFVSGGRFDCVIDATHPFAESATQNIRAACEKTGIECLRLVRNENDRDPFVTYVDGETKAAELLNREQGNVLFAIGIRRLEAFASIRDFADRSFVRILPMIDSIEKALQLGVKSRRLICMHGPFGVDLNKALIAMCKARFLVTKDSGEAGGLAAKIDAAKQTGCRVIVLNRPRETGLPFDDVLQRFGICEHAGEIAERTSTHFPLFVDMKNKPVLVVGGGKVAERRVGILQNFGAAITVVSPMLTPELQRCADRNDIRHVTRRYEDGDVAELSPFLVIAATNDRDVNRQIAQAAEKQGVLCVVSDCRNECSCYFPAIMESSALLAGLVSKDGNHRAVADTARRIREIFNNEL